MSNKINLGLTVLGDTSRKTTIHPQLTLDRLIQWIKNQELDEYTTQGLIDLAKGYPTHALPNFRRNFAVMLSRVRAKRTREQGVPFTKEEKGKIDDWQKDVNKNEIITKTSPEEVDQEESQGSGEGYDPTA